MGRRSAIQLDGCSHRIYTKETFNFELRTCDLGRKVGLQQPLSRLAQPADIRPKNKPKHSNAKPFTLRCNPYTNEPTKSYPYTRINTWFACCERTNKTLASQTLNPNVVITFGNGKRNSERADGRNP